MAQVLKYLPAVQETQETRVQSLDQEDSLEEEMATHSSILAWESPWTGNLEGYSPGGLKESDMTEHTHTLPDLGILAKFGDSLVFMVQEIRITIG